jgi:hypothetical protein
MDDQEFRDTVVGSLARIEEQGKSHGRRITALENDVLGNGDSGLKERITTLEERSTRRDWSTTAIGSVLAAAAAIGTYFGRDSLG